MKPTPRSVQFRMGALLLLVALAAGSVSLWRWKWRRDGDRQRFELHAREEARYAEIIRVHQSLIAELTRTIQGLQASPSKSEPSRADELEMTIRGETAILESWKCSLIKRREEREYHRERSEFYRELLASRWPW